MPVDPSRLSDIIEMCGATGSPRQRTQASLGNWSANKQSALATPQESRTPVSKERRSGLLTYDEISEWHQDNEHILSGYRPETNSVALCFASWAYIHNETFNIFSHLVPTIASAVCLGLLHYYFLERYPDATTGDQLVFGFFLLTAAICFWISSTFHTLLNHSAAVSKLWLQLDYVGIVILTLGDFVSGIYLIFYCERTLRKAYWTMVIALKPWISGNAEWI